MGWFYDPETEPLLPIYKRRWFQILIPFACISLSFILLLLIWRCAHKSHRSSLPKEHSTETLRQPPRSVTRARVIRNVQPTTVDENGPHLNSFYTPAAYKEIPPMYNGSSNPPPPPPYAEPGRNTDGSLRHPYQASREDLGTPPPAYRGFQNS